MRTVDPKVYELAASFVYDTLQEINRPLVASKRQRLIQRAAEAMQQAIEDECTAIREELLDHRYYADVVDSGGPGDPGLERDR